MSSPPTTVHSQKEKENLATIQMVRRIHLHNGVLNPLTPGERMAIIGQNERKANKGNARGIMVPIIGLFNQRAKNPISMSSLLTGRLFWTYDQKYAHSTVLENPLSLFQALSFRKMLVLAVTLTVWMIMTLPCTSLRQEQLAKMIHFHLNKLKLFRIKLCLERIFFPSACPLR